MRRTRYIGSGLTAVCLSAAVLLTGCSGSGGNTAESAASAPAPDKDEAGAKPAAGADAGAGDALADEATESRDAAAAGPPAPGGVAVDLVALAGRDVVFTAELSVQVDDVAAAAARAEDIVGAAGGLVAGEETSRDPDEPGTARARLTVRVPADAFRSTLSAFARLGRSVSQTQTAQDVTEEVTDLDSRLATQRASVERVRALLAEAKVIADIVSIEGELARREAELESLQARRARLSDLTALSTITVTFLGPGVEAIAATGDQGFLAGFGDGWAAFRTVVVVMLTVLGAVLPFVLVGALVVVPLLMLRRRRRAVAPAAVAAPAGPDPAGSP